MKHLFLGMACALSAGLAWGQDVPYTTEIMSQPYATLEEYSLLDLELGWDDPEVILPIPFDMVLWGDTCTVLATANLGEMIVGTGNANHLIAPVFSDICDVAPADSTGQDVSEIRHTLEGAAPNRIFKVEYHNVGFYDEVYAMDSVIAASQRATYQVWLHETGTITYHYGPNTITDYALLAADAINTAGLFGNFDPYSYGGTLLVAEGAADTPQFQSTDDIFGWIYSGAEGWGNTWPSEGTGYVFNPIQPTSVSTPAKLEVLTAFPNPAHDVLHVQWDGRQPADAVWVDAQGQIAGTARLQPGRTTLDVCDLEAGAYLLRMKDGTAIRVVIQH
ncbi:MAG TPA: hypothetical protein DEA66_00025 [Flavobacteriales bacterium]|nr:hypothetical protein [Flavobacteriales bacterium]